MHEVKASPLDDDAFRLLAYPFTGPIPFPLAPKGADVDIQWFTERTDIARDWLPARPVDFHHRQDPTGKMRGSLDSTVIGKAVDLGNFEGKADEPDEDGWWVTVWMQYGDKRAELVKRLASEYGTIYGSTETLRGAGKLLNGKGQVIPWDPHKPGEIVAWPYWRQTLSTSPQNTHSVIRPLKATLDDLVALGVPSTDVWIGIEAAMRSLGDDFSAASVMGQSDVKAGRVLRRSNEAELRAALAAFEEAVAKVRTVLSTQPSDDDRAEEVIGEGVG